MLNWLFQPQLHKSSNGYYLNHDNLILAGEDDRKKLIFYFIASQTPEKLDPKDYDEFKTEQYTIIQTIKIRLYHVDCASAATSIILGGYTANKLGTLGFLNMKLNRAPFLNFAFVAVTGFVTFAFSYQLGHALFEPKFVADNQVVNTLAKKYNFTVFDFALAKKESHLKQLRAQLSSDSEGVTAF